MGIPDLKFHRREMFIHEDKVVVLGEITGTINNDQQVQDKHGLPFFPGVDPQELDGKNQTLINQTFTEDYNMRPNPLNPQRGVQAGPLRSGLADLCSLQHVMMRDMNVTRMYTAQLGNIVLVLSNVPATMNHIPPGLPEFPMFPGIPGQKLKNKVFNTLSMDLHVMDNAQIRRSCFSQIIVWHLIKR